MCQRDPRPIAPIGDGRLFLSLSETWLDSSCPDGVMSIPGYRIFRRDRHGRGDGVAIFCPDGPCCRRREDLECNDLQALWIELGSSKKRPLLVCTIYRPPDTGCQFFDSLSVMLETANKECKEILVMGDFNLNYLSDCSSTRRMQSLSDEGSLTQMIAEPTRVTQNSMTLIDRIYASSPGSFLESGCLDAGVSDHLLVYTVRVGGQPHGHKTKTVRAFGKCNNDHKCNNESLLEDLQSAGGGVLLKRTFFVLCPSLRDR